MGVSSCLLLDASVDAAVLTVVGGRMVDGFAPACLSALMAMAAIEGPAHWFEVIPMLGGVMRTLEVLKSG